MAAIDKENAVKREVLSTHRQQETENFSIYQGKKLPLMAELLPQFAHSDMWQ
jgi:hypothetical protein